MSIHHKVNDELVEFASKVSYTDSTAKLKINGIEYQLPKIEVVSELPSSPDLRTYYFVTT